MVIQAIILLSHKTCALKWKFGTESIVFNSISA